MLRASSAESTGRLEAVPPPTGPHARHRRVGCGRSLCHRRTYGNPRVNGRTRRTRRQDALSPNSAYGTRRRRPGP
ncbi:hypothetical protein OG787_47705 [Streptomyces sp. NBC_00075]|uniref:hypothetical protein n=1 Tax=Streptomyces sp. NBC_00075 TaxID=2975641 RepID=UPI0032475BB0